tara:strand:- start:664 stop:1290 length:627 start_codon:yes stop_codon:yes gene_type:complete
MIKFKKILVLMLISMGFISLSAAEVEYNVALANDYIWRGMSQTDEDPAVSGGFDVSSSDNGAYFGVWGSYVDFGSESETNKEVDYYFGYTDESARGVNFDIGYISYNYPQESILDFEEIYVGLTYKWVGVTISKGLEEAPDNTEWSVGLGDSGFGVTYGDYDGVGKYTLVSFDFPNEISGISFGIGLSDFDSSDGTADEDGFVITFSL